MLPINRNQWLSAPFFIDEGVQTQYNGSHFADIIINDLVNIPITEDDWIFKGVTNVDNIDEEDIVINEDEFKNLLEGN